MSNEPRQPNPANADEAEPIAGRAATPIWLIALLILLAYGGMLYLNQHAGGFNPAVYQPYASIDEVIAAQPMDPTQKLKALGKRLFIQDCQVCHQATGLGTPGQYPPLVGSDWVNAADPNRIIRIVLNGAQGPLTLNGQAFHTAAVMIPWRDAMKDEEIAAVLTYVRSEWGNKAPAVDPKEVTAIREKIKNNSQPFSPDADLSHLAPGE